MTHSNQTQPRINAGTSGNTTCISIQVSSDSPCLLHWGLRKHGHADWVQPSKDHWPEGTVAYDKQAVRTPFPNNNGAGELKLEIPNAGGYSALEFVLFYPKENRWDNNGGRNYRADLTQTRRPQVDITHALKQHVASGDEVVWENQFDLADSVHLGALVVKSGDHLHVSLLTDSVEPLILHWGVAARSTRDWSLPPESIRPPNSVAVDQKAVQTPFALDGGLQRLGFVLPSTDLPAALVFVLKEPGTGRWLKEQGGNFVVTLKQTSPAPGSLGSADLAQLADEIIRPETTYGSWTLMHRYNLCHDLLDRVHDDAERLALVFAWMRFSAIRELDWQRHYNTKPRELAHAQDRLTHKLASLHNSTPEKQLFIRLMLASVGRGGGDGQKIRDEILNIMHRHHIKEVSGHFMEEWHQKLHNNTTPDDVVICEAFLEFQYSHGNRDRFYQKLNEGGVTRERLAGFERPIRSAPDFIPHLRDGLIHDFQNFLRILKAVHSGTDLEVSIQAAQHRLNDADRSLVWDLFRRRFENAVVSLAWHATEARRRLAKTVQHNPDRELIGLDLALEQFIRTVIERSIHLNLGVDDLTELASCVLENLASAGAQPEFALCHSHWSRLKALPRSGREWALHAKSVLDRASRALSSFIDNLYQRLQPKAEFLGNAFHAEPWTIELFSEEVVRGGSLGFTLSMLVHHLEPLLREMASLGPWQIVSRGSSQGTVELTDTLRAVQGRTFATPTVIIANQVHGDEEIPPGVTAVIAPNVTDIVSHVAVRARNAGVLFASCFDAGLLDRLRSFKGRSLHLDVNPAGDVVFEEGAVSSQRSAAPVRIATKRGGTRKPASPPKWVINMDAFDRNVVGGKSCHLAQLRGKLPEWIHLPASVAIPFGAAEATLALECNRDAANRCSELAAQVESDPPKVLGELRAAILKLQAPAAFQSQLNDALQNAGLAVPDWEVAWHRIKEVWASKWNERAWLSRRARGVADEDLLMAVLVQEVVPAEYAFVLHTVNPITGVTNELYAELVPGLGETLVGNYPGRALGVVCDKPTLKPTILSFPAKSLGLFGDGLIFRSDSNGEDLEGFAGAGLYDSVLLKPAREVALDYANERLVWDDAFRTGLVETITRAGLEIERAFGSAQDVEGAWVNGKCFVVQSRPQVGLK